MLWTTRRTVWPVFNSASRESWPSVTQHELFVHILLLSCCTVVFIACIAKKRTESSFVLQTGDFVVVSDTSCYITELCPGLADQHFPLSLRCSSLRLVFFFSSSSPPTTPAHLPSIARASQRTALSTIAAASSGRLLLVPLPLRVSSRFVICVPPRVSFPRRPPLYTPPAVEFLCLKLKRAAKPHPTWILTTQSCYSSPSISVSEQNLACLILTSFSSSSHFVPSLISQLHVTLSLLEASVLFPHQNK